jgi:uncharacterized membrane protein YhaH (DUF805 family)
MPRAAPVAASTGLSALPPGAAAELARSMTFFDAIKTGFRKYAEFGGRATRPEFWWWTLFTTLVSAALNALSVPMYGVMYGRLLDPGATFSSGYSSFSFAGLWGVAVLLPSLAVAVRRLRDAGRNWPELFWLLLPIAGLIILIVHLCEPSVAAPVVDAATPAAPEVPASPAAASPAAPKG